MRLFSSRSDVGTVVEYGSEQHNNTFYEYEKNDSSVKLSQGYQLTKSVEIASTMPR